MQKKYRCAVESIHDNVVAPKAWSFDQYIFKRQKKSGRRVCCGRKWKQQSTRKQMNGNVTAAERSEQRAVDRAAKKRILLSTTTKGLVQWYLSTHLDSSSRLDPPNRSYWRAPLSPRGKGTRSVEQSASDKEGDGHLSYRVASHWAGPRQGVSLRCAQSWWGFVRRIALQSSAAPTPRARRHTRSWSGSPYVIITNRIETVRPIIDCDCKLSIISHWFFINLIFFSSAPAVCELEFCVHCVMFLFCFRSDLRLFLGVADCVSLL